MVYPPSLLVCSGRRFGAGPGRQSPDTSWLGSRRVYIGLVFALAVALMVAPALVALLSLILERRLDGPDIPSVVPFQVLPILAWGRVLVALALAVKVIRTAEPE